MRHAQLPASPLCRVLSNIEIEKLAEPSQEGAREYAVRANSILYEMRIQSTQTLEVWPARLEYKVRADAAGNWKLFFKKDMLVNGSEPLSTLGFLI